jgi:CBS-domain-containing membrane protein
VRINSKDVELLYGTERIETEHEGSCAGETSEGDCGASRYSGTKVSVKSAVDHLETHGLGAAPVTDPEGTLVGKISNDRMIRGVSGRGHDPQTTPIEPEVDKEGEPYCYEHEPIAKAEEVMREMKVDAVSVVSEEKKLIGKVTRDAVEEERLKVESGKPRTDLKKPQKNPRREHDK